MKVIEDMDMVEVIIGDIIFAEEVTFKVDIIVIEWIGIGKIGEHGDNPGPEKEKEIDKVDHHLVLDQEQELSTNRDRIRCFRCREYGHFSNECPNLVPDNSDRESDSARSVSLLLADSDTGSDTEQYFKCMKGRNGSTSFLPSIRKGGFQKEIPFEQCLTKGQTKHIYDKIETGEEIRIRKLIQQNIPGPVKQDTFASYVNQYEKALLSDSYMRRSNVQMDQWSILSDNIVYVRSKDNDIMDGIDIKSIDYGEHKSMYKKMNKEGGKRIDIDFGDSPEVMKNRYMDVYDNVHAEVVTTGRFDENVDLSTTYLGRIDMKREEVLKAEESFPISEQGFVKGRLINGEECQILLDTGVSKSYMSKSYYLRSQLLHNLPKFASKNTKDSSRKWSKCRSFICHTVNS